MGGNPSGGLPFDAGRRCSSLMYIQYTTLLAPALPQRANRGGSLGLSGLPRAWFSVHRPWVLCAPRCRFSGHPPSVLPAIPAIVTADLPCSWRRFSPTGRQASRHAQARYADAELRGQMSFAKIIKPLSRRGHDCAGVRRPAEHPAWRWDWSIRTAAAIQHLASGRGGGAVAMPWLFSEISNGNRLCVSLPGNWLSPRRWHITPDEPAHWPGHQRPGGARSKACPAGSLSDWRYGFDMDLSPWLHRGANQLDFVVDNYAWNGESGPGSRCLAGAACCWRRPCRCPGLWPWCGRSGCVAGKPCCWASRCWMLCCYWAATPWTWRNYDVKRFGESGHLGYVEYLATHLALPLPGQGWEYAQPPLYYIAAAPWFWRLGTMAWPARGAGAAGVRRSPLWPGIPRRIRWRPCTAWPCAAGRWYSAVATAALVLWPSGIIHGSAYRQ